MFGLFKKKSEVDVLKKQYEKLLQEAFDLSKTDRSASDAKHAEAEKLIQKIEELKSK